MKKKPIIDEKTAKADTYKDIPVKMTAKIETEPRVSKRQEPVKELTAKILKILKKAPGPLTVKEIREKLNDPQIYDRPIREVLYHLKNKGWVEERKKGKLLEYMLRPNVEVKV